MITYQKNLSNISQEQLAGFFEGWPNPPSTQTHLEILKNSYRIVLALDEKRVVGFITCISDGILSAYIPLLEVVPSYKDRGIGTKLVQTLLEDVSHLYMIDLLCDPEVQSFYTKLGLDKAQGMLLRNYKNQSGKNHQS